MLVWQPITMNICILKLISYSSYLLMHQMCINMLLKMFSSTATISSCVSSFIYSFSTTAYPHQGRKGLQPIPAGTMGARQRTCWTSHQFITGITQRDKHPFTLTGNLVWGNHRTLTDTGRTGRVHTERCLSVKCQWPAGQLNYSMCDLSLKIIIFNGNPWVWDWRTD